MGMCTSKNTRRVMQNFIADSFSVPAVTEPRLHTEVCVLNRAHVSKESDKGANFVKFEVLSFVEYRIF